MTETREWTELRVLRIKDGHTIPSLATACGINRSHLWKLECGEREPTAQVTRVLAVALNVPVSVLTKRPDPIYTGEELHSIVDVLRDPDAEEDEAPDFYVTDEVPA